MDEVGGILFAEFRYGFVPDAAMPHFKAEAIRLRYRKAHRQQALTLFITISIFLLAR